MSPAFGVGVSAAGPGLAPPLALLVVAAALTWAVGSALARWL